MVLIFLGGSTVINLSGFEEVPVAKGVSMNLFTQPVSFRGYIRYGEA